MKSWHWNGEFWYRRDWSLFHRVRNWFVWLGGWEKANGEGWQIVRRDNLTAIFKYRKFKRLLKPGWWLHDPFPVSLFGHKITFQPWGWSMRTGHGWLVYSRAGRERPVMYLSSDGTPSGAYSWYLNPPPEVVAACREHDIEVVLRDWQHNQWRKQQGG